MKTEQTREAWNKGKLIGQKPPLKPQEVWAIRIYLHNAHAVRDLAMFNLAIDSKLRGCDRVAMVKQAAQGRFRPSEDMESEGFPRIASLCPGVRREVTGVFVSKRALALSEVNSFKLFRIVAFRGRSTSASVHSLRSHQRMQ